MLWVCNRQTVIHSDLQVFDCASRFLFAFLTIHPFGDGNGRLARLLCGYILYRVSGSLWFPILYDSDKYVKCLIEMRKHINILSEIFFRFEAIQLVHSLLEIDDMSHLRHILITSARETLKKMNKICIY